MNKTEEIIRRVILARYLVLGVAIVILLVVTYQTVNPSEPPEKARVTNLISDIEQVLKEVKSPDLPRVDYAGQIKRKWEYQPQPVSLDDTMVYRPTIHLVSYYEKPKPPLSVILPPEPLPAVTDTAQPDRVTLPWLEGKFTARVIAYRLYRRAEGQTEFELLAEVAPVSRTYTDASIKPEIRYEYYLTSLTDEKTESGNPQSGSSVIITVLTPEITRPYAIHSSDRPGEFTVIIEKYLRNWNNITYQYRVKLGDKIGVKDRKRGDFTTNYILKEIKDDEKITSTGKLKIKKMVFYNERTKNTIELELNKNREKK